MKKYDIHLFDLKIKIFLYNFARFYDGIKSWSDALDVDANHNANASDNVSATVNASANAKDNDNAHDNASDNDNSGWMMDE
jgi:hypothetical protein